VPTVSRAWLIVLGGLGLASCSPAAGDDPLELTSAADELAVDGALRGRRCEADGDCQSGPELKAPELFEAGGLHELRFDVANQTERAEWVLEIFGQVDEIEVVAPAASAGERTGHFVAPEARARLAVRYALPLRLPPGEVTEVVLHARLVPREVLRASVLAEAPFRRRTLGRSGLVGFALGGMLFLAVQALFVFGWTRDRAYLWYGLYALAGFALWSVHFGYAALLVPDGELRHQLVATLAKLMVLCVGLFTMRFLELWGSPGKRTAEARAAIVVAVLAGAALPLDFFVGRTVVKPVSAFVVAVAMCCVIGATIRALWNGKRRARFLMVSWFPALSVAVVGIGGMLLGERGVVTRESLLVFHVWELVFGAFAFADRMRILRDERDLAESEAERQRTAARTDALTGLQNRTAFDAYVESIAVAASNEDRTLVVFDVDGLKAVNDTLGHTVGDQMLQTLADTVASKLRAGDQLFRIGGDEFVLAIEAGDPAGALMIRRLEAVVDVVRAAGFPHFGLSAGHCSIAGAGGSVREAFRRADARMYEAKALHRAAGTRVSSFPAPVEAGTRQAPS